VAILGAIALVRRGERSEQAGKTDEAVAILSENNRKEIEPDEFVPGRVS
jgi:hypothetical protein